MIIKKKGKLSKSIYIQGVFLLIFQSLFSINNYPVNITNLDSVFSQMTIDEKIQSVLINNVFSEKDSVLSGDDNFDWVNIDDLFLFLRIKEPFLSDIMIRSALMKGENDEIINLVFDLLEGKGGKGFFYNMKSPYSLMFKEQGDRAADYFLEPYGRIVLPLKSDTQSNRYFLANTYKLPKRVMAPHAINQYLIKNEVNPNINFQSNIQWKEVQRVLREYESPSLEFILHSGGLIYTDNYLKDYQKLKRIFTTGVLPESILEKSCKKGILCRELYSYSPSVSPYFNRRQKVDKLVYLLHKKGVVLLENKNVIPLKDIENRKIASIHIGSSSESAFQKMISKYCICRHFNTDNIPDEEELLRLKKATEEYNTIIVGVNGDWFERDMNHSLYTFLHQVSTNAELILVHFGSGNRLEHLPDKHPFKAIILSFSADRIGQEVAAQITFGGIGAEGMLAKKINNHFSFGTGYFTTKERIGFAPEYIKAVPDSLSIIDQIVYKAIRERATPGCQVLVAKDGDVIYSKAFGYHTYNKRRHVLKTDLFDIASITKIVASVPMVMKMVDEHKIDLKDSLLSYLPRLRNTNKEGIKIEDMLIHQAGLEAWIPFYINTIDKDRLNGDIFNRRYSNLYNIKLDDKLYLNRTVRYRSDIFRRSKTDKFNVRVSDKWYMNENYLDSMTLSIDTSEVKPNPEYKYSDLGYYYLKEIIEKTYNKPLNELVENELYKPLGAFRTQYHPLDKYNKREIIPTENDRAWRNELLQGYVHDPGAAMLGGVGGHAGIFSTAEDLVKILQMYLNKGQYAGKQFIDSATIQKFTSLVKVGNRRGLGFDKPVLDPEISGPSCHEASPSSYGHSGFTGTIIWVDPDYNLIYIFLSNRIHPNQYNKKLIKDNVRTNIQSAIYHSLPEFWEKN